MATFRTADPGCARALTAETPAGQRSARAPDLPKAG